MPKTKGWWMKWLGLLVLGAVLSGCSTDERIIAYCGEKHPNSQWGQMICQFHQEEDAARMEILLKAAKRETDAKSCIEEDKARMSELFRKVQGYAQVAQDAPLEQFIETLDKEMPTLKVGLVTTSVASPDKYRNKIAAFAVKTKCDSDYSLEGHILANWDNHPSAMRVYANSPPSNYSNEIKVDELGWQR